VGLFVLYVIYHFFKDPVHIIINSVVGLVLLFLSNMFFHTGIVINIWSLAIVAIGGVVGLIMILLLHFLGIAF